MKESETSKRPRGERGGEDRALSPREGPQRVAKRGAARSGRAVSRGDPKATIDLGPLDNYIAFHLRLAQEIAVRAFVKRSGKADFSPGWFAVLMTIRLNPGISQSALARAIGRDKSTVSPLIRQLHAAALVVRRPSIADRRSVTLALTKRGESELETLLRHVEAHDRRLDEIVGEDKPKLIALLRKIADALA
ncbi:MAG TPA: MarR family transcriptional regulator [Roseiarcus sp.]|nr:MarR family transcriptional regulator [Roseiarcus sp.]